MQQQKLSSQQEQIKQQELSEEFNSLKTHLTKTISIPKERKLIQYSFRHLMKGFLDIGDIVTLHTDSYNKIQEKIFYDAYFLPEIKLINVVLNMQIEQSNVNINTQSIIQNYNIVFFDAIEKQVFIDKQNNFTIQNPFSSQMNINDLKKQIYITLPSLFQLFDNFYLVQNPIDDANNFYVNVNMTIEIIN